MQNDEQRLDELFRAYREACPAPEASAHFMPNLWARIEARQSATTLFGRLARSFATAGMALSMLMAALLVIPQVRNSAFNTDSYIEALAAGHASEQTDLDQVAIFDNDAPDQDR